MKTTRYCCQVLIKLEFSRQISENYADIKFHENPSRVSRAVPCGQTHEEANSRFMQFCERILKRCVSLQYVQVIRRRGYICHLVKEKKIKGGTKKEVLGSPVLQQK